MPGFTDALRGYALPIHRRDAFCCRYCGLDGTQSFANWLSLSWDHLLPKSHPNRDNPDYIVTACMFCNTADNRYFDLAAKRGLRLEGLTPDELVAQRLPYVEKTRDSYREFWADHIESSTHPRATTPSPASS
jgi:5-methylcytosine-specific restriction endonuclease McrA